MRGLFYREKFVLRGFYICFFVGSWFITYGQQERRLKVETLSKPSELLQTKRLTDIYKDLIYFRRSGDTIGTDTNPRSYPYQILAWSSTPDSLVSFRARSFFRGMETAYADHRPFVLSPDMIWLLINQGFARHINSNPEKYRPKMVSFSGKKDVYVTFPEIDIDNPEMPWSQVISSFINTLSLSTKKELVSLLSADFTTSTEVTKIANQITIMETLRPYYNYKGIKSICGIPEVVLQGSPEDWRLIIEKTRNWENTISDGGRKHYFLF